MGAGNSNARVFYDSIEIKTTQLKYLEGQMVKESLELKVRSVAFGSHWSKSIVSTVHAYVCTFLYVNFNQRRYALLMKRGICHMIG